MQTTNIDALGRIRLPPNIIRQFSITNQPNLLITLDEPNLRIILCPTQENRVHLNTGREIYEYQAAMLILPPSRWQYIRGTDDLGRIVLPLTMRSLLGWTEKTALSISYDSQNIFIQVTENHL